MEDQLEEPTLEEKHEGTLRLAGSAYAGWKNAEGAPEKENYGVSQRLPSPILVGLFLSISQPCGMIVQTANLVDF